MPGIDHTTYILYRFLKELSVKISYGSIRQSLDTPMGNTLRGISDALDEFHIVHEVYQLPAEYLKELECPFISVIQNGHFCIVKNMNEKEVMLISDKGKKSIVSLEFFLTIWKGTVLIIDPLQTVQQESYYRVKQIVSYLYTYRYFIILALAGMMYLFVNHAHIGETLFNLMTWVGLAVAIGIIYKESYDKDFLQRFCKIGTVVDCNGILHSKAANIGGLVSLGEMALLYFSTLFLYTAIHGADYLMVWVLSTAIALITTLWSVVYQVIIAKKLYMLCTLLDMVIWAQAAILYGFYHTDSLGLTPSSVVLLLLVAGLCCSIWYSLKELISANYQSIQLKTQKEALLSYPVLLDTLLSMETEIPQAESSIVLHNEKQADRKIQIIINPHCKHCALHYKEWLRLDTSVSLLFFISDRNRQDKEVALAVISCYIRYGFRQAMDLLGEWFDKHDTGLIIHYPLVPQAEQVLEAQRAYCNKIHLQHTPFITINERKMPGIYTIEDLHYVL